MRGLLLAGILLASGCHALLPLDEPGKGNEPDQTVGVDADPGEAPVVVDSSTDVPDVGTNDVGTNDVGTNDVGTNDVAPTEASTPDLGTKWIVATVAGTGVPGFADGTLSTAQFDEPHDVAVDPNGMIYVADFKNHCIRKIDPIANMVTTLAGSCTEYGTADGKGSAALFNEPASVTLDPSNTYLYVADFFNNTIRRVEIASQVVTTIAGKPLAPMKADKAGPLTDATFNQPADIAVDPTNANLLYVLTFGDNHLIKIDLQGKTATILTGGWGHADGLFTAAKFMKPHMMVFDAQNRLIVTEFAANCIRRVDLIQQQVDTITGQNAAPNYLDGTFGVAQFQSPSGIAVHPSGQLLFVTDFDGHRIRTLDLFKKEVTTLAGSGLKGPLPNDGPALSANIHSPEGMYWHDGKLYVAEYYKHRIRVIKPN